MPKHDDSSDDDEPLFSSPDTSDKEQSKSNDDNDVFKFTMRKFQGSNTKSSPSSRSRRRPHAPTLEDRLHRMEQSERAREKKLLDRIDGTDGSDDDSDSHTANLSRAGKRLTSSPPAATNGVPVDNHIAPSKRSLQSDTASAPKRRATDSAIELLGSDSDDDDSYVPLSCIKGMSREALDVLQRSQAATRLLKQAQHYHAEDFKVQVQSPPRFVPPVRPTVQAKKLVVPAVVTEGSDLGKRLRLTCRTRLEINGKKDSTTEHVYEIRENECLSLLLDKISAAQSIPSSARVALSFDGITLSANRTPASYEIEDEDLVDVTAKIFALQQTSMNMTVASSSRTCPKLDLTLRTKVGRKVQESSLRIGKNETFQQLLQAYKTQCNVQRRCIFSFDGETLDMLRTPAHYDMETGDLIDVIMK